MKLKNIICPALAAILTAGVVSSCEDLLKVDSKIVMYDYQNTLDHATDTVYSVMGIISKIQKIADRTVILNEVRGDLVSITDHASTDLRKMYNFDFATSAETPNMYDSPVDYYAVINNCNFFLEHADTAYVRNHKNVFLKEYITVLSYRAWTYLQMAQVYGKVYFVNKPIVSADMADAKNYELLDIKELAEVLLADFEDRFKDYEIPNYGSLGGETTGDGQTSESHNSTDLFIPVRIIMGDLNLWAGNYVEAAQLYSEYLTYSQKEHPTTTANVSWFSNEFVYLGDDSYSGKFGKNMTPITYIPMEIDDYNGNVSQLPNIFNSTEDNDYWNELTYSYGLSNLSAAQNYCYHEINLRTGYEQPTYMADKLAQDEVLRRGDLRLQSILTTKTEKVDDNAVNQNDKRQTIAKIYPEKISIYRDDVIYLRLAEALNRAGLPNTAFAVLKYGLCYETFYLYDEVYYEMDKAAALGLASIYDDFNSSRFEQASYTASSQTRVFDGLNYTSVYTTYYEPDTYNTIGIHSRGCGDAAMDSLYIIPDLATIQDSIRYVEERIVDEMALETCFEGYRFGDLMRVSMHRAQDAGYPGAGGFADNSFLAGKVAARESENPAVRDEALYETLNGDGTSFNGKWFLRMVK